MKYNLLTYEECKLICDAHKNFIFYETIHIIDNFKISIFNYRLASPPTFNSPIENSELKCHEMRGLTFVFNTDGTLYKRYLMLNKFFNLNQCVESSYNVVKDYKIKDITYKEDGTLVSFIQLPNARIIARTKNSFECEQCIQAQKIYDTNLTYHNFVNYCIYNDIVPIFEFCAPFNRIVIQYSSTQLILTKLRNNNTGNYLDLPDINNLLKVKSFNHLTLDDLIHNCKNDVGYEGYVVMFDNEFLIKLKLQQYIDSHNLHTERLYREDAIISLVINEQIDDILGMLDDNDERKLMILDLEKVVNNSILNDYNNIKKLCDSYTGDKLEFVRLNKDKSEFYIAMRYINFNDDIIENIKKLILKKTYFLKNAREWLKEQKLK